MIICVFVHVRIFTVFLICAESIHKYVHSANKIKITLAIHQTQHRLRIISNWTTEKKTNITQQHINRKQIQSNGKYVLNFEETQTHAVIYHTTWNPMQCHALRIHAVCVWDTVIQAESQEWVSKYLIVGCLHKQAAVCKKNR